MPQFDALILAVAQESDGLKVDEIHLRQVENGRRVLGLNPFLELFQAVEADPADQPQDDCIPIPFCLESEHRDARFP
jgi:hypothetical protein